MGSVFNRGTKDRPNWYAKIKDSGAWKQVPTHQPTKAKARKWMEEREAEIASGAPRPDRAKTFGEAAEYWLVTHSAASCDSHPDNVGRMKHLTAAFGTVPLGQITAQRIDQFKAARKAERVTKDGKEVPRWAVATVNRMLALLRKVLNDAATWGWIQAAPKVKLLPQPEQPFDFLSKEEAKALLDWTKEHAPLDYPLYAAAIYTGARMGELYGLRWVDVDLNRSQVTISRSYEKPYPKGKKIRHPPINKELGEVLTAWRRACPKGDLVFPREDGTMRVQEVPPRQWKDHLKGAGVREITFHDLRHTAASLMVMAGMSLRTVQKILGHSTITTTERYAHLAPDFMASEADKLSLL